MRRGHENGTHFKGIKTMQALVSGRVLGCTRKLVNG